MWDAIGPDVKGELGSSSNARLRPLLFCIQDGRGCYHEVTRGGRVLLASYLVVIGEQADLTKENNLLASINQIKICFFVVRLSSFIRPAGRLNS